MKSRVLKVWTCLTIFILMMLASELVGAEKAEKIVIVTVDSLELRELAELDRVKSVGMISMVAGGRSDANESHIMSMAVGRRVELDLEITTSVQGPGGRLSIVGYDEILDELDEEYKDFSKNMPFLGATLFENSIVRGYMGESSDVLLLSNREGYIDHGVNEMVYEYEWLSETMEQLLDRADVVHLSYDIGGMPKRRDMLVELIESRSEMVMVISKSVPQGLRPGLNRTLSPVFVVNDEGGILSSESTRRRGVISNLDIKPTILHIYGLEDSLAIGNPFNIEDSIDPEEEVELILSGFLNLSISKYVFHGIIISIQLLAMYMILFKRRLLSRFGWILLAPSAILLISVGSSLSGVYRYYYLYVPLIILIAVVISRYFYRQNFKTIDEMAVLTNVAIIAISIFNFDFIYNSFIGYNNIVAGGRFYGFNNDIMGVFIVTSIMTYYYISDKLNPRSKLVFTIIYLPTVIILNSGAYGNNFGGLLTSVFLGGMIVYLEFLNGRIGKRRAGLIGILTVLLASIFTYALGDRGHIGEFFIRVNRYGATELINMIEVKVRQLLFMAVIPPWSIMLVTQSAFGLIFIKRRLKEVEIPYRYVLILGTAIFALLVNDTGVVSFVYIMSYFVSMAGLELIREEE